MNQTQAINLIGTVIIIGVIIFVATKNQVLHDALYWILWIAIAALILQNYKVFDSILQRKS